MRLEGRTSPAPEGAEGAVEVFKRRAHDLQARRQVELDALQRPIAGLTLPAQQVPEELQAALSDDPERQLKADACLREIMHEAYLPVLRRHQQLDAVLVALTGAVDEGLRLLGDLADIAEEDFGDSATPRQAAERLSALSLGLALPDLLDADGVSALLGALQDEIDQAGVELEALQREREELMEPLAFELRAILDSDSDHDA